MTISGPFTVKESLGSEAVIPPVNGVAVSVSVPSLVKIKLSKNETPETLSKKILSLEHSIYPRVIEKILQNE